MELIDIIIALAFGFYAGYKVSSAIHEEAFKDLLTRLDIKEDVLRRAAIELGADLKAEDEAELIEIPLRVEQHSGVLYAYRKDTEEFVGQAADKDALIKRLAEDFDGVKFIVTEDDGAGHFKA